MGAGALYCKETVLTGADHDGTGRYVQVHELPEGVGIPRLPGQRDDGVFDGPGADVARQHQ